jgi:UDP-glucose 4-epimerase
LGNRDWLSMKKRVLITGGAGFIGSALANQYSETGDVHVMCIDNLSTGNWDRLNPQTENLELDLTKVSIEELVDILFGVDILFHLAAVKLHNTNNSFEEILRNNIEASQRLFEAAGIAGVPTVVFTSSLYVYGLPQEELISEEITPSPTTIYGASKLFGESLLNIASKKFGYRYAIARLFFIYGENQYAEGGYKSVIVNNFERLRLGQVALINGDGNQTLDYLYVRDCVKALVALANNPTNEVFNVSSGSPLNINDLTREMLKFSPDGAVANAPEDWTHGTRRVGSFERIHSRHGWSPQVSIQEGLSCTWNQLN